MSSASQQTADAVKSKDTASPADMEMRLLRNDDVTPRIENIQLTRNKMATLTLSFASEEPSMDQVRLYDDSSAKMVRESSAPIREVASKAVEPKKDVPIQVAPDSKPIVITVVPFFTCSCVALVSLAVLIAASFIFSVIFAQRQAAESASNAASFDDSPFTPETAQWNLLPVEVPSMDPSHDAELYLSVPPNHYLPNVCANTHCAMSNGDSKTLSLRMIDNYIRLELTYANLVPAVTGGTVTIVWHVSLPLFLLDQSKLVPVSAFKLEFKIENTPITIAPGSSAFDGKIDMRLNDGTIYLFPMDTYTKTFPIFCSISDPNGKFNGTDVYPVMNFWVKIDKSDLGAFSHTDSLKPFYVDPEDGTFVLPKITSSFTRPIIGRIFPMFIIVSFWLIPIFEVLFFASTYMGAKCSTPAPVSVAIGMLFALPGIRNTAGNGVPIGSVMDFGSFFWAELIAILCFMYISYRFYIDTRPVPK